MPAPHSHTQSQILAKPAGGEATAAQYARALQRGVDWLRFEPAIEAEYLHSHVLRLRTQARFWQLLQLGAGIFGAKLVLDGLGGESARMLLLGCVVLHLAISAVLVYVVFSWYYTRVYHSLASMLMPFRASALAVIVAAVIDAGASGTAGMTINMFGLLFFSGLLLRNALPAALAMTGSFIAALAAFDVHTAQAVYSITSLLVVFGLAGFVAWDMQRAARRAFLEHALTRADATRDALTGLVNRRHFDSRLEALWRASASADRPLTVMLIDVDHFKAYNDGYGHQAGDEALRRVAQALVFAARPADLVARYGGEEMALLATGLGEHEAETLGGRLRRAVEELDIPHEGAPDTGRVTVSIGGACIVPLPGRSAAGALQLADQNLYEAKRQGRNRVMFHSDQYALMRTGVFRHPAL